MESKQRYEGNWKSFILFTCIVGLVVGFFSVQSDNIPYFGEGAKVSIFKIIFYYISIMINSLPMWFIMAMIVGYVFGQDLKKGVLFGAIYTVVAITIYFVISFLYTDVPVHLSLEEQIETFVIWYGMSLFGGCVGGGVGFIYKKTPYILLLLIPGLLLQLFLNGTKSWNDIVGISQNVTFCFMIVGIFYFLITAKKEKSKKIISE